MKTEPEQPSPRSRRQGRGPRGASHSAAVGAVMRHLPSVSTVVRAGHVLGVEGNPSKTSTSNSKADTGLVNEACGRGPPV